MMCPRLGLKSGQNPGQAADVSADAKHIEPCHRAPGKASLLFVLQDSPGRTQQNLCIISRIVHS
uniref:Uncharacterized protein n=1 Tax=mine drainage metagenome TaxID=410659 RepID=E6PS46_9ZZZZ